MSPKGGGGKFVLSTAYSQARERTTMKKKKRRVEPCRTISGLSLLQSAKRKKRTS